ncbi:pectinesterase family protein [Microbulbifer taiwanensis]|uniref:Pectinesterase family protein n=1 Tax=Microbulbifer taiwanensis TaxID=986746 RepID=A0ABW1YPD8_9GAMM|nr:pectinesterase family protein [Microbulbifer taiwanensis]
MRYLIFSTLALFFHSVSAAPDFQAVVDSSGGEASYRTIGAALAAAPAASEKPYVIYIRNGHYREKLTVNRSNIALIGESQKSTLITYGAFAGQKMPGSDETWGTFHSATLTVLAPDFSAGNLTIENSFDFLANDALDRDHPRKIGGTQAVALALDGGSDRVAFRNVRISGFQDTLYANTGRSYFVDSIIEGNVDFIFDAGTALFENSDIVNRRRAGGRMPSGYITAPSTNIDSPYGFVFLRCQLRREDGVPAQSVPLGRPWHPTTDFDDGRYADPDAIGASVFIDTYMDDHISREGWTSMRGTARDGTKSMVFTPESARFFEYLSRGPGAAVNAARRQLSTEEAMHYARDKVLRGWIPPFADP